jgi:transcriptional regulator NrdR family protein
MQLKVVKTDGAVEEYLHTKVIGTISNALARAGQADICTAEQLAEAVTYYLYHKQKPLVVASNEVFSMIEAVLTATGYEEAAIALNEHHFERKLKRSRIEVVSVDVSELADAEVLCTTEKSVGRFRWDKSKIVNDLVAKHDICRQTARTIASIVEERIFNMGVMQVPASLINQLVLRDAAAVLRAERHLQAV